MQFCYHRGGLQESLETAVEIENMDELYEILSKYLATCHFSLLREDLVVRYCCYDERIKLHRYIVKAKNIGVLGFINMSRTQTPK